MKINIRKKEKKKKRSFRFLFLSISNVFILKANENQKNPIYINCIEKNQSKQNK